jgi:hypothetical protein
MKKILLAVCLVLLVILNVHTQIMESSKVPSSVKDSFAKNFPGAKAKWEKEADKFEAGFKQNDKRISALFDSKGNMLEIEVDIKVSDLPASVLIYVKDHYNGKNIKAGAKITKANGIVNYEAEVNGKDLIFDANGINIKEVKG